ncbi:MAG: hypothetical protein LBR43_00565 [Spiroplasmataceae bacterium]|nr:hypothetical protein [Spiroplasmataceae bacterium]
MTENNLYELPKTEIVQELKEVQLPNLSEITDESGKVKLPDELINKLRDPNARFEVDLTVCPSWTEEWDTLEVSCMATGCSNTTRSTWRHANFSYSYPSSIEWSTHARLKCPTCWTIADISRWSFKCHGGGHTYRDTDLIKLTDVVSALLELPDANRQFAAKFLKSAKEIFN